MGLYHPILIKCQLQLILSDSCLLLEGEFWSPVPLIPLPSLELALMLVTCFSKWIRLVFRSRWVGRSSEVLDVFLQHSQGENVRTNVCVVHSSIPSGSCNDGSTSNRKKSEPGSILCVFLRSWDFLLLFFFNLELLSWQCIKKLIGIKIASFSWEY